MYHCSGIRRICSSETVKREYANLNEHYTYTITRSWYVTQTCPVRWAEVNAMQTRDELVVVEIAGRRGMILAVIWAAVAPPRQLQPIGYNVQHGRTSSRFVGDHVFMRKEFRGRC